MVTLKTTPLTAWHQEHGARLVDFAGWEMPVQYTSIITEHLHTRQKTSIFDICHMGEFYLRGKGATKALGHIVTHNLDTLHPGKCRYGFMLNEQGGILDDLIIYCLAQDEYMLVVNGACEQSDFDWIKGHLPGGLSLENASAKVAKIDVQGPESIKAVEALLGGGWRHLKYFGFERTTFAGAPLLLSRTGYTGELGYELYLDADKALEAWERLAAMADVKAAGLGARDTLRLEMGYPLYGQDLDTKHTPVEAGYGFLMNSPADFIGKDKLDVVREKLIPLEVPGRRSARHGDRVSLRDGKDVGVVTSGSFSPSLGHCIALAYVTAEAAENREFLIQAQRSELCATRTELPFHKAGTARVKLD